MPQTSGADAFLVWGFLSLFGFDAGSYYTSLTILESTEPSLAPLHGTTKVHFLSTYPQLEGRRALSQKQHSGSVLRRKDPKRQECRVEHCAGSETSCPRKQQSGWREAARNKPGEVEGIVQGWPVVPFLTDYWKG